MEYLLPVARKSRCTVRHYSLTLNIVAWPDSGVPTTVVAVACEAVAALGPPTWGDDGEVLRPPVTLLLEPIWDPCRSFISNFFIWVSTSSATKDLILRSSKAAKCFAFTAAEANAAAAAVCTFASLNNCFDSSSFKLSPSIAPSSRMSADVVPPDTSSLYKLSYKPAFFVISFISSSAETGSAMALTSSSSLSAPVPAMPLLAKPKVGLNFPAVEAFSTFFIWLSIMVAGTSSLIAANSSIAALAAAAATLGSTTEAKNATPNWLEVFVPFSTDSTFRVTGALSSESSLHSFIAVIIGFLSRSSKVLAAEADEENSCVLLLSLVFPVCEFSPSQVDKVDNACAALPPVISSSKSVIVPPSMVTKVSILM
uniref:Uncharacterized protein n=1 Tax=Glossina austeni TaxID=7395 RepID=A0A1A9V2K2_GLOAU